MAAAQSTVQEGEKARVRAVRAPNVRLETGYEFFHVESSNIFDGATTLNIPNQNGSVGTAELIGTVPIYGPVGARLRGRARYGNAQRSLDGLTRGNRETLTLGGGAELILRDPGLGSLSFGGGYDFVNGESDLEADQWSGTATANVFFPDLGQGPVDWTLSFDFAHRDISGTGGSAPSTSADLDGDRFTVTGSASWYLTDNVRVTLGGRWDRTEEEFVTEEDREGFALVRWRLPGQFAGLSAELSFGGFAGKSELKQSPFQTNDRLVYGVNTGIVLRFGSGLTLLESIRQYD